MKSTVAGARHSVMKFTVAGSRHSVMKYTVAGRRHSVVIEKTITVAGFHLDVILSLFNLFALNVDIFNCWSGKWGFPTTPMFVRLIWESE